MKAEGRMEEGFDEQIVEGDTPEETDVEGQQGEVDWSGEPVSDALLSPEVRQRLAP